ncbi:MAG: type II toxin-antitoxin system RelE/ParE family toxin [Thiohalocapsa sp.]|uniref:type II toxin-antitoxin system RelE/ParE family toxin n=1 Tax=Thiohalocapsa sp. TaxID=2497641 RepID=UPI0025D91D7F|nr:type II toxin-antitoxin system RelE/ParE family toxin [Thiohalocapsa sp.]MCG6939854.1 type II toxin-antitoxin system RelE/ParE family toxin [Thiohalocapsa sp.]
MRTVRLAPGAIADIRRILLRSKAEFGAGAGTRYKVLLAQALQDLGEDAQRVGVRAIPDVRPGYFVYHVKFSKPRVTGRPVGRPRHLLVFSIDSSDAILVAAVVHEREMLERHLES